MPNRPRVPNRHQVRPDPTAPGYPSEGTPTMDEAIRTFLWTGIQRCLVSIIHHPYNWTGSLRGTSISLPFVCSVAGVEVAVAGVAIVAF